MKKVLSLTLFVLVSHLLSAQNSNAYTYYVDLTKVENDQVQVLLETPSLSADEVTFYMPKIIPGTYSIADYGRFISEFTALDKKGKPLPVNQVDDNSWVISKAKKLKTITYKVDDSFDFEGSGPEVFWPAGTNIEEGENFIINSAGFFGYFDNMKGLPFNFNIVRPEHFYGGTGLIKKSTSEKLSSKINADFIQVEEGEKVDTYVAENFDNLVDSPLMYSEADTAIIRVSNTEVLIASYSPNKVITAKQIAGTIEETLMAQNEYLGGKLPVDKYAFVFYFTDQPVQSYGALEHSYSSLYYIPENTVSALEQTLRDFAAHEFFHIITPLTIHSEEIHRFDFNDPEMSKHLWLYEGVTEYFAGNVQIKYGLIGPEQYIGMLREKLIVSNQFIDDVAFTEISKNTLEKYEDQYYNVYQKGALIGMCLDLQLMDLSNGEMNLRDLILKLSERYGKDKAFQDDELFDVITELTYPEIGEFLNTYVGGDTPIPYKNFFEMVGITYEAEMEIDALTLGIDNNTIGLDQESGKLFIRDTTALNELGKALGFKQGDLLVQINDQDIPPVGPELQNFIGSQFVGLAEGKEISYTVSRENEAGEMESVRLSANNFQVKQLERFVLMPSPNATPEQVQLREKWLKP